MGRFIDMTGQEYGELKIISRAENLGGMTAWLCECSCGKRKIIRGSDIRYGRARSCGHLISESTKERLTTHGGKHTRLYNIWCGMKRRCNNANDERYPVYGGRGINVCDEWSEDFSAFREWALHNGYNDTLTIDRIDANRGYEPDNCRWTSQLEQVRNRTITFTYTFRGETKPVAEWAKLKNIPYTTLAWRVKNNWSEDRIFERVGG